MNTYIVDNLSINCSLNDDSIYLRVVDTASFATFETKCDSTDLVSSLEDSYTLICNCLSREIHHTCDFHVENGNMCITFDAKIGGYFCVHFDVFLIERKTTKSGKLSAMVARMETRQNLQDKEIESLRDTLTELQSFAEALSFAEIRLTEGSYPKFAPLNSTAITFDFSDFDVSKVCLFPRLKELNIFAQPLQDLYSLKSNTVEKLTFRHINYPINLREILNNFPNLTALHIELGCVLPSNACVICQGTHQLKNISLPNATPDILEITRYCADNNIAIMKL
jgi:hypothetical protein